jgi:hypothetical protein
MALTGRIMRLCLIMKQITLNLDDATFQSAEKRAQKAGRPLAAVLLDWVRQFSSAAESDYDRLAAEEAALRERMMREGRLFSGGDRLTRGELHDRHALR